ncbi:MAG: C-GCAxxG-C-C family protein [Christensenella sp.]
MAKRCGADGEKAVSEKALLAEQYFKDGYNCCQAVVLAFTEEAGIERETALRIASSFGGGMGRLREVCGAVSGMFMIAGLVKGYTSPTDTQAKAEHYARIQRLAAEFRKQNGAIVCRELLGINETKSEAVPEQRTEAYYKKRPCAELVRCAAEILEKEL